MVPLHTLTQSILERAKILNVALTNVEPLMAYSYIASPLIY
jgi:hypothetical protein